MTDVDGLRARLAVRLFREVWGDEDVDPGPGRLSVKRHVDIAVDEVVAWLRDEADRVDATSAPPFSPEQQRQRRFAAAWLEDLADTLDPKEAPHSEDI